MATWPFAVTVTWRQRQAPESGQPRSHAPIPSRPWYQLASGGIAKVASWASMATTASTSLRSQASM